MIETRGQTYNFDIIVKLLNGDTICEVRLSPSCTVHMLKKEIEAASHVRMVDQQISFSGEVLCDEHSSLLAALKIVQSLSFPVELMLTVVKPQWTNEEILAAKASLETSVRSQSLQDVNAILQDLPFHDDDRAQVLGCEEPEKGALVVAIAVKKFSWRIVKMIMSVMHSLPPDVQTRILLPAMQLNGRALWLASQEMKSQDAIVMAAIEQHGSALQYVPEHMKVKEGIVMAAVRQDGSALQFASEEAKASEAIVLAAVQQQGNALQYAAEAIKNNRAVVMQAVQQAGAALKFASSQLKNDDAIVIAAVSQWGCALEFASAEMKDRESIVMAAVQQDRHAVIYASGRLLSKIQEVLIFSPDACTDVKLQIPIRSA